ncbi:MAG: PHP domain-containing protein [Oscillospiraceae bacterium]|jgi:PHP family Zn ribbon phosphoesterase|nr:PHP domain-containing protein [Oscillospiraceae bacterium]
MTVTYDLHIHSCLSPCGDNDSTPTNIAALGAMLGLQVMALTDHNTALNCPAFFAAAKANGVLPIAGMELTTEEEIHAVCLFAELEDALRFSEYVYERLFPIDNDPEVYGDQLIMNENEEVIGTVRKCLINATTIDFYSASGIVAEFGGVLFPAHIERKAFSLISSLGFVPDDCGFNTVEIRSPAAVENLKATHPYLSRCRIIHDSDAHTLENLSTEGRTLELTELSAKAVIELLRTGI